MGVRNSDVIVIESLLSWLHDRITLSVSCHKSMGIGVHGNAAGCTQLSNQSEFYCQNGPSVDSRREGRLVAYLLPRPYIYSQLLLLRTKIWCPQ